jgi:4-hydroxy-tetrahydrodipicolinate synthase
VILYNLPPATGVNLEPDTVGALASQVMATSADMAQAGKLIHTTATSSRHSSVGTA